MSDPNNVTPAGVTQIEHALEELFSCDDPTQMVNHALAETEKVTQLPDSPDRAALLVALNAATYFGAGLRAITQADFAGATENLRAAYERFSVGAEQAKSISYALSCFCDGTRNASLLNFDRARELWAEAESYLTQQGGLQDRYRFLLDQFKPDQLYLAGGRLLLQQDFEGGRSLLADAARAASEFADRYLPDDSPVYHQFKGLSQFYSAEYNLAESMRNFAACGYDRIIANEASLIAPSSAAEAALAHISNPNEIQRRIAIMSDGYNRLQRVLIAFAKVMQNVMLANFNREAPELAMLQVQLAEARKIFGGLGPNGVSYVRHCEQLSRQIENVQRLTRPGVKDFGVYSGFVSAIAFVPLLLVTGWVFNHFGWGVPPVTFLWVNVGVAALVGFGAGALTLLPSWMKAK
jgi:hypothetical protein